MIFPLSLAIASVAGFIALSYEILWYRAIAILSGGSPAAFGVLLGFYLAGIAMGSYAVRVLCAQGSRRGDPRYLRYTAALVAAATVTGFLVLPAFAWLASLGVPSVGFLLVAVSAAMLGAVLPLVSHFAILPDERAGARLSYLYLSNIVGSVLGSFLTGFVLLDVWRAQDIAFFLTLLGWVVVMALLIVSGAHFRVLLTTGAFLTAAAFLTQRSLPTLFGDFYEKLIFRSLRAEAGHFRHIIENRSGVIAVTQNGIVYGSGAYDGRVTINLLNDPSQIVRAFAVAALHPAPKRVLMIGLSGGAWAQVIAHQPGVESLTIVEINPGYLQLVPLYPSVASVLRNPKVHIIIDDGRRWLSQHAGEKFDVIVSNTTLHWRASTTNLLSLEYVKLVAAHLDPGGVYYFNTTGSTAALKTSMIGFPYGVRFRNFAAVSEAPISFDRARFREVLGAYRIDGRTVLDLHSRSDTSRLDAIVNDSAVESRQHILSRLDTTDIVTDDNMLTEWHPTPNE
jgi:spermidine synthase